MLKLLILFPLMLIGGAIALSVVVPVLALLPLALAAGAAIAAFALAVAVLGLVLRVVAGLLIGTGVLFVGAVGFGALFAGGAVVLVLGFALAHLLLPLLVIAAVIWLIRHFSRPTPLLPAPSTSP